MIDSGQVGADLSVSVITCFDDSRVLRENIVKSLAIQRGVKYEFLPFDGTKERMVSLPRVLNSLALTARGNYLMFVHQDVHLLGNDWLLQATKWLNQLSSVGGAGVAGMTEVGEPRGFIVDRGRLWCQPLEHPLEVQTLDEMLLITPRTVFNDLKFDENFRFHAYVADYCVRTASHGLRNYVLPCQVEHNSISVATLNASSLVAEDRYLRYKHKDFPRRIFKTTGEVSTASAFERQVKALFYGLYAYGIIKLLLRMLARSSIVVDVGCVPMERDVFDRRSTHRYVIGVTHNRRYLECHRKLGHYDDYLVIDYTNLPFREASVDTAVVLAILEYLPKKSALEALKELERVSKNVVIKVPNRGSRVDRTHYIYVSQWNKSDFSKIGYKVLAQGIPLSLLPRFIFALAPGVTSSVESRQ